MSSRLTVFAVVMLAVGLGGCGGSHDRGGATRPARQTAAAPTPGGRQTAANPTPGARQAAAASTALRHVPAYPVVHGLSQPSPIFRPVVTVGGRIAAWAAQRAGVTLIRFDQGVVHLALHAGSSDPGGSGWYYGHKIGSVEIHHVVAAFNGGFRLNLPEVGFMVQGQAPVPLSDGLASVVTYRDGTTQIGAWHAGVPARGKPILSVRQNLHLLVDHGSAAGNVTSCVIGCWGATLGGGTDVARSALGITGNDQLVYAAGASLSPATLANVMAAAGVQRAQELDINPMWVAGYVYRHRGSGVPDALPLVPGQVGIAGQFLQPYSRDFFTVVARP